MSESSSNSGRRPRFKTRAPSSDPAEPTDESLPHDPSPHEPPELATRLVLPGPAASGAAEVPPTVEPELKLPPANPAPAPAVADEPDPERSPLELPARDEAESRDSASVGDGTPPLSLPNMTPRTRPSKGPPGSGQFLVGGLVLLVLGLVAGYFLRGAIPNAPEPGLAPDVEPMGSSSKPVGANLTPAAQAALNKAFGLVKTGRPKEARAHFAELLKQYPAWTTLALEEVRAAMFQQDGIGAKSLLDAGENAGRIAPVDAAFFGALLRISAQDHAAASRSLAQAAALDPTRADIYYFWGNCLRRQGKPAEAADRFRSAILRNQQESLEGLYLLKLRLAELESNSETAGGTGAAIDAGLAKRRPSGFVQAAAAARDIREGRFAVAADRLREAEESLEAPVFKVVLADPTFLQENWRPEFAEFYGKKGSSPPNAPGAQPSPSP